MPGPFERTKFGGTGVGDLSGRSEIVATRAAGPFERTKLGGVGFRWTSRNRVLSTPASFAHTKLVGHEGTFLNVQAQGSPRARSF